MTFLGLQTLFSYMWILCPSLSLPCSLRTIACAHVSESCVCMVSGNHWYTQCVQHQLFINQALRIVWELTLTLYYFHYFLYHVPALDAGLEILAFPCNQFGEEEPGSNDQIVEFVCTRFKSEFPIFDKVDLRIVELRCIYALIAASLLHTFLGHYIYRIFFSLLFSKFSFPLASDGEQNRMV